MNKLALIGGVVIDGNGGEPLENGAVLIEGNRIKSVEPNTDALDLEGYEVINVEGQYLIPGLIDTHLHFGGALSPSDVDWVLEPVLQKALVSVSQAKACLDYGITSVGDISRNGTYLRDLVNDGVLEGPRINTCGMGMSRTCGHGDTHTLPLEYVKASHPWAHIADGSDELRKMTREIARTNPDMIKIWATGGGLWRLERKTDQHYTMDEIKTVVEEASLLGLPVRAHAESLDGAKDCIKAGVYSIEHGQELDDECLELMVEKDIRLVPTMQFFYEWFTEYEPPYRPILDQYEGETTAEKELNRTIHNFKRAYDKGVKVAVGSDSFCSKLTPYGKYSLMEIYAMNKAGLSPMETIVAATKSGAEMLQMEEVGSLDEGKFADLVVLKVNPLDDITEIKRENMRYIIKDGLVIREN